MKKQSARKGGNRVQSAKNLGTVRVNPKQIAMMALGGAAKLHKAHKKHKADKKKHRSGNQNTVIPMKDGFVIQKQNVREVTTAWDRMLIAKHCPG